MKGMKMDKGTKKGTTEMMSTPKKGKGKKVKNFQKFGKKGAKFASEGE